MIYAVFCIGRVAFVFDGAMNISAGKNHADVIIQSPTLLVWGEGDEIQVAASDSPARLLLVSGTPLNEPIARHGPFVMNTPAEIEAAVRELQNGTFPPNY